MCGKNVQNFMKYEKRGVNISSLFYFHGSRVLLIIFTTLDF